MANAWTDTHAHLYEESLASQLDMVLERAAFAGVTRVVAVAVDATTSAECLQISKDQTTVWATAGIHPNYAHQEQPTDWKTIVDLTENPRVVALGETGLDKHWNDCPFEVQQANFARHWQLSRECKLPVIIHSRDCEAEMMETLRNEYRQGELNGVMHSFAGSIEAARECIAMGLFISFSGILTYKKAETLRQIAKELPIDRLLIETDCPYLSPEPYRSVRPNEPAKVVHTASVLADSVGVSIQELSAVTQENTARLFWRMSPIANQ